MMCPSTNSYEFNRSRLDDYKSEPNQKVSRSKKIEFQAVIFEEKSLGEEKSGRSRIQKLSRKTQQKADLELC